MAVYRRSARPRFVLLLLVLTSVTLLTLDERGVGVIDTARDGARDVFEPIRSVSDTVMAPIGNLIGGVLHYGDLEAENERLREENDELRGRLTRSEDANRENEALRDQLDLESVADIPTVAARVVLRTPSNHDLSVVINRGSDDGLADGMPVVTGAGLVGRLTNVSRSTATVLLLKDRDAAVGVRLASGDVGVAGGAGVRNPLRVDGIDPETRVTKGELVVTSGLQQSLYPPNIPVGRVTSARQRPGGLEKVVDVEPAVDIDRLSFVSVLLWSPLP